MMKIHRQVEEMRKMLNKFKARLYDESLGLLGEKTTPKDRI